MGNPSSNSVVYDTHTLVDDMLGTIVITGTAVTPGNELVITDTTTITQTTTNTATWEAVSSNYGNPILTATAVDTARVVKDTDQDGIPDEDDPRPRIADPTGCFYDVLTGEIIPGGSVAAGGAGITLVDDGSSTGCYSYLVAPPTTNTVTLNITPPADCRLASCPREDPPAFDAFDANNNPQSPCTPGGTSGLTCIMGAFEDGGNPGFLTDAGCQPLAFELNYDDGDGDVINNNIPLVCGAPTPAPAMSQRGYLWAVLLLVIVGIVALRRRTVRV